jgi:integrase
MKVLLPGIPARNIFPPPALELAIRIIFLFNLRASELLSVTVSDIFPGDRILIQGAKGSNSAFIFLPGVGVCFPEETGSDGLERLFPWSYQKVWGWVNKMGLAWHRDGRKNNTVTHSSRYITAEEVYNKKGSDIAGEILRHRSRKSVSHYISSKGV